jgi:mannan endo-1,4-beta-mannosidase
LGGIVTALFIVGGILYSFINLRFWSKSFNVSNLSIFLLLFSFIFYVISLYSGQASLILPLFAEPWYKWTLSNTRYGIQMLLPAAFFIAYLAHKIKYSTILFALLIVAQTYWVINTGNVIVYNDGTRGLSSQAISKGPDAIPVEKWVNENYNTGLVLMDDYRRPISPVNSGIPMNNFIGVGNKPYWDESLDNPTKHADWIIVQKADTDAVWRGIKNKQIIDDYFVNVYTSGNIWVYKKRDENLSFVRKQGQELVLNNKKFKFSGANVYDLLTLPKSEVDSTYDNLKSNGINVIRFWGFNKQGKVTSDDLQNLDYIISESKKKEIHLIIVLGNQWEDFGGPSNFTSQINDQSFYTDENSTINYYNHISRVVDRYNTITGNEYKNEHSILAWELLNEPRVESDRTNKILSEWVNTTGQHILNIDNNHLIAIGTEGFIDGSNGAPYEEYHGADFSTICGLVIIDFCSTHLYPKYFKETPDAEELEGLIERWNGISLRLNKPIYIGEVGFDLNAINGNKKYEIRKEFFEDVNSIVNRKQISGAIIWNVAQNTDNHFSLSFDNKRDSEILAIWGDVAGKSAGLTLQ